MAVSAWSEAWQSYQSLHQPYYAPHTPFSTAQALRIGYILRKIQRQQDGPAKRFSLAQTIVLAWVCMFGSLTIAQCLLGMPALWLTSPGAQLAYVLPITAIISLDWLFDVIDAIPAPVRAVIEVFIDGTGRIGGLTDLGVDMVRAQPNKALANPFAMLFIATLVAGGGDLVLPSFNMLSVDWKLTAPPVARGQPSPDLWSCPFVAAFYASLVHAHPFFAQFSPFDKPWATDEAKAASALLLMSILSSARLVALWQTPSPRPKQAVIDKKLQ